MIPVPCFIVGQYFSKWFPSLVVPVVVRMLKAGLNIVIVQGRVLESVDQFC